MENENMTDLLKTFKTVLNTNTSNSNLSNNKNTTNNLNITPEMISNLANNLKNNPPQKSSSSSSSSKQDFSNNTSENTTNIDFDTILKVKSILDSFNQKDDKRSNLLYSLKPYLRVSRQKKVDQYVNLFKLSGIAKILKQEKGDLN